MKNRSILFTVNVVFIVSLLLVSIGFVVLYDTTQKREQHFAFKRGMDVSKMFLHECRLEQSISPQLQEHVNNLGFKIVQSKEEIQNILSQKTLRKRVIKKTRYTSLLHLKTNNEAFFYIQTPYFDVILQDTAEYANYKYASFFVYLFTLLVFVFLYSSIIQKLRPLAILQEKVRNLGEEEYDIDFSTHSNDEIAQLAKEFDKTAKKLKAIRESRNIFIRNIMHELKTPITKGNFLLQLPHNEENKEKMRQVFYRLEALINEFAQIEELLVSKKTLQLEYYSFEDVLDNALDLLLCDEDEVVKNFQERKIKLDFKLFSIALKNLLDNGIKYAEDKKVYVAIDAEKITISNYAQPLLYPLKSYFEPFFKERNQTAQEGFGLGLYICKHIFDAHSMHFAYEHKNGLNSFFIFYA